jgi:phosphoglycolate phosphatase-like HAD superfamily hydrolase
MNNPEPDFQPTQACDATSQLLDGTSIELIRPIQSSSPPEYVLFDFDGTLSLIREGWADVMVVMMEEVLAATGTHETPQQLRDVISNFVAELTGKQTIYQMIRLAEEVSRRGGQPRDPLDYKHAYHNRLMNRIDDRRVGLRSGAIPADDMLVPGSLDLLDRLRGQGVQLYLASGTDEVYVRDEAALLGIDAYFAGHIYGAVDDYRSFSKALVIQRILEDNHVNADKLVGFGDGYVEIQNIKEAGGIAVGVASDESGRSGQPDRWKRERLVSVGADLIVPDYQHHRQLLNYLWGK